ncbi:MAG: SAM-dependent methyltransferase [Fluviicola sp.]|nr:MAG: SAM-dependent methyltransferase [Fluviicola sp.]
MKALDQDFWNDKYINNQTGWDLGQVSPPIKAYIDQLENKSTKILIPGAGNAYEADYLLKKGFKNITIIDIAPRLVEKLKGKWKNNSNVRILQSDFFNHKGKYDLIIEQTFFCAIDPSNRRNYVKKMNGLLNQNGKLVGLLFDRYFEGGPPFGGSKDEYEKLFTERFELDEFETAQNSVEPRFGMELWINCRPRH